MQPVDPTVSVVMPVYNGERFLREAVDSVLAQSFSDFELLIVDDGSSDRTPFILREYARKDTRIRRFRSNHLGAAAARNLAIESARGILLAPLDADDRMLPDRLSRQVQFMRDRPEVAVSAGWAWLIDTTGKRIGRSQFPLDVAAGISSSDFSRFLEIVHSAVIMRKTAIQAIQGYRSEYSPQEDRDLWGRMATAGYKIEHQPEMLCEYRLHGGSLSYSVLDRRLGYWLAMNIQLRLEGRPEISAADYAQHELGLRISIRVIRWRDCRAMMCYKNATRHFAEGGLGACMWSLMGAIALRPVWTGERIIHKRTRRR